MNKKVIIVLFLFLLVLFSLLVLTKQKSSSKQQEPAQSGFPKEIEEAKKKAEEERKAAEEKKKKEEETRQYIAKYGPCRTIPILMYHHVDNQSSWLYVKPEVFAGQMDYLVQKGYTSVTLPEITNSLITGSLLPPKPIAITFDDGYRDFHANAFSILRARNLKATIFLITQLMEGVDYLTWEQAREIAGSGMITIGDHTLDHRSMVKMTEAELRNEIINSRQIIESNGLTTNVFAYPFGGVNNNAFKILAEAGFVAAVTASRGFTCAKLPFGLSRIRIGNSVLSGYGL